MVRQRGPVIKPKPPQVRGLRQYDDAMAPL
jgi:hypothetical protein